MPLLSLPPSLGPRFSVSDALTQGVDPERLRRSDLAAPFHGVRRVRAREGALADRKGRPLGALEREHLERARDFSVRLGPGAFFSHITAAIIWGIPLPYGILSASALHVSVFAPDRLPRVKGVRGHQTLHCLSRVVVDPWSGLPVTTPASTWAMLGAILRNPYDLVAAGDAAIRTWRVPSPLATVEQLRSAVAAGRRVGVNALRDALTMIEPGSASRPETWCRLILAAAGLPRPMLNFDVHADTGEFLGTVDLAYPWLRIAFEYEGEHHLLDPEQWARDILRYERLAAAGRLVIRVTKSEVFETPDILVARARAAVAERSARLPLS